MSVAARRMQRAKTQPPGGGGQLGRMEQGWHTRLAKPRPARV